MLFALVGNQNCGKTTLFNRLTGLNQHTGNFPGVTVGQKVGNLRLNPRHKIADLPGVYSLTPFSSDENVTRDFLKSGEIDGIINIADANNPERGLYLTTQLLETGKPMVLALNMMDEVRKNDVSININVLESALGIPVIPISASKNQGIDELVKAALDTCKNKRTRVFFAESDKSRYEFIENLCGKAVTKTNESREYRRSRAIDRVLLNKYLAFPIFFAALYAVFSLSFDGIGAFLSRVLKTALDTGVNAADSKLSALNISPVLRGFLTDGVLKGIVSVLGFLPVILTLFLLLSLLEDSGYMARIVFLTDKPLKKIGLSGRSVVPLVIGFGCTVPAVMAARTLPSDKQRKKTILLTPFMSCSAKIPVYALFTAAFFGERRVSAMFALYGIGIVVGVICACLTNKKEDDDSPFLIELPNYRLPNLKSALMLMRDKAGDFISRAFTVILISSMLIWFLMSFDTRLMPVSDSGGSMLAGFGKLISPLFAPLGFGDWRAACALITGFAAKETVVSTLTVLGGVEAVFPGGNGVIAFLTFTLLYTPCVAAISAVRKELGSFRETALFVLGQCMIAWAAAFLITRPIVLAAVIGAAAALILQKKH